MFVGIDRILVPTSFADIVHEVPISFRPECVCLHLLGQAELLTKHRHRQVDGQGRHPPLHAPGGALHGMFVTHIKIGYSKPHRPNCT